MDAAQKTDQLLERDQSLGRIIADLSEEELWKLFAFIKQRTNTRLGQLTDVRDYFWKQFGPTKSLDFLNLLTFGSFGCRGKYQKLTEAIPLIKQKLGTLPPLKQAPNSGKNIYIPPPPVDFHVENTEFKSPLFVTKHAWERFWERFSNHRLTKAEEATKAFTGAFKRAQMQHLPGGKAVQRVLRHRQWSTYLYDSTTNLRFVVAEVGERETRLQVQTVEIPK